MTARWLASDLPSHGHIGCLSEHLEHLAARHVGVIIRGQPEDLIDTWLRSKGIERHISLIVSGYLEALHVVRAPTSSPSYRGD